MKLVAAMTRFAAGPIPALACRLYLGGLFVYASIYKINYPAEFAETVAAYEIVPYFAVNLLAVVLPWVELICGTLLIVGIRPKAACAILFMLLIVFTVALAAVLARGVPIGCGCFHTIEDPISGKTLVRDLIWLVMASFVYFRDRAFHLEHLFMMRLKDI